MGRAPRPAPAGICACSWEALRQARAWGERTKAGGGGAERRKNQEERKGRWQSWRGSCTWHRNWENQLAAGRRGRTGHWEVSGAWRPEATFCTPSDPDWWYDLSKMPCALGLSFPTCQMGKGESDWARGSQPFYPQRTPTLAPSGLQVGGLLDLSVFEEVISRTTPPQCFRGGPQQGGLGPRSVYVSRVSVGSWHGGSYPCVSGGHFPSRDGIMLNSPWWGGMRGTVRRGWLFGWDSPRLPGPDSLDPQQAGALSSRSRGERTWPGSLSLQPHSEHS